MTNVARPSVKAYLIAREVIEQLAVQKGSHEIRPEPIAPLLGVINILLCR